MKCLALLFIALAAPILHAQTFTLSPADCGDHRSIICTAQVVEGGTFYIELGREKHKVNLAFVGPDKLSATDYRVRGTIVSGDGTDRLIISNLNAKDASGNVHTGSVSITLQARSVNGVKTYTLTAGTVTVQ